MLVIKFGGSSVKNIESMKRSAQIAIDRGAERGALIVCSAMYGVTNLLVTISKDCFEQDNNSVKNSLSKIKELHIQALKDLGEDEGTGQKIQKLLTELETLSLGLCMIGECSIRSKDKLLSFGEILSTTLFTQVLKRRLNDGRSCTFLDARDYIKTDDSHGAALPLLSEISRELKTLATGDGHFYVTQGFIGSTHEGVTTTLGRGGSDYSASLFAEGLEASELQILTDVDGMATTDPRVCKNAKIISEIQFDEAAELAVFGAKILHPTTLVPAMRQGLNVFVGSSYNPEAQGTWIRPETTSSPLVRAIAFRRGQALLAISNPRMLNSYGFLAKLFPVFDKHRVSVDAITTSEISVAVTVEEAVLDNKAFMTELRSLGEVKAERELGLISMIGNSILGTSGLAHKVFELLGDINVRMICLGASVHNLCLIVDDKECLEGVKRLHEYFCVQEGSL